MKDAHGEKAASATAPGTKTSSSSSSNNSSGPLSVTGIVKNSPINIAKLGPPPPLVPIKSTALKLTLPAPALVKPASSPSTPTGGPKPSARLPTAAQVMSGMKVSPQLAGIRFSPLLAGRKIVQVGQSASPGCRCQVKFYSSEIIC